MDFRIPHSDLSPEEKRECMEVMRTGNDLMKAWAEDFYGRKNLTTRLRRGLFKWKANPADPEAISPEQAGIPDSVMDVILKVKSIESKVMFGYVRMVVGLSRRFLWATKFSYLDMDDLILEGLIALRDAIYSFSNEKAEFSTYAHWAVKRRLRRKIYKASDLGQLGETALRLLEGYYKHQRILQKQLGYEPNRTTVMAAMNLTWEQEDHLEAMFRRVVRSSDMQVGFEDSNPYENLGEDNDGPDLDMLSFEHAVEASDMERELIQAALRGEERFRSKIAQKHINPETNKPYSRMSATNMLRRAYYLVQKELKQDMVAA
jgi:DNA-directed RNA polymerase specialized sigma subunit